MLFRSKMTQDERDEELEGKPRVHICVWCKQILFEKPPGIPPTDEEASDIANHIMNCEGNPLVQKVKRLEEGIKEVLDGTLPYLAEQRLKKLIEKG